MIRGKSALSLRGQSSALDTWKGNTHRQRDNNYNVRLSRHGSISGLFAVSCIHRIGLRSNLLHLRVCTVSAVPACVREREEGGDWGGGGGEGGRERPGRKEGRKKR